MIYLVASILLSSYLTLSFKLVKKWELNNLQVIVFNYITCVITGSLVNGRFPVDSLVVQQPWFTWACVMGTMFIILFNIIAFTAQYLGVAVASVANKLSLVIPFAFSIYLYNEHATVLKITGIIVALIAVFLTCWTGNQQTIVTGRKTNLFVLLIPVLLFIGSGLLDTLIKYVEQNYLNDHNKNDYLVTVFAAAAGIGIILLTIQFVLGKQQFSLKAVLMGIGIGIPNYFSIWFLIQVLKQFAENSSSIIPVNNMGIVLCSTLVARIFFNERLSSLNWAGVVLSLGAIALIAYG